MSVEIFVAERPRLVAIAYRIVGSPDDADDVVQDAWLRFDATDLDTIANPPAWLTTVTTRLAIDRLRATQRRREAYVGPWLSSPVDGLPAIDAAPDRELLLAESLSLGFLAVLERVSPLERAVFILHDIFGYPLGDVAHIIERTPPATRQLAKRARDHVQEGRPRFNSDPNDIEQLTQLLLGAALQGNVEQLASYLADDVVHVSDGGRDHRAARAPILGPQRVARFFAGLAKRIDGTYQFHDVIANGQRGLYVTTDEGEPFMLQVTNWVDGKLAASFAIRNPVKLSAFHRSWCEANAEASPPQ